MLNAILVIIAAIGLLFLFHPRLLKNTSWQATLTPLSSIIGSGFLIIAPMLASVIGIYSPIAVLGIVLLAYSIGGVIRFNIVHAEPLLHEKDDNPLLYKVDFVANAALSLAYVTAVAFYLSLLSSFLLNYLGFVDQFGWERALTTVIIVFIATTGYLRGLGGLEKLEAFAMSIQLSIVAALLVGVSVYDFNFIQSDQSLNFDIQERSWMTKAFMLAGILLVVQGFETSRFLGEKYNAAMRVRTMRRAQLIAGVLYVISVIVLMPIVQHIDLTHIRIADIVSATGLAAAALPLMLIVAAIMSQFSAGVADTVGAGGLASETSRGKLTSNKGYLVVSVFAIILVWTANLLEIIALASRAFALYYMLQCVVALLANRHHYQGKIYWLRLAGFSLLAVLLLFIVLFAIPAE
jgi:hypothetical protein